MEAPWPQRLYVPAVLAGAGIACALLAALDKLVGWAQQPLALATGAYACLLLLLAWSNLRGIHLSPRRLVRPSVYSVIVSVCLLTAVYAFTWRQLSADPTPIRLAAELQRGDDLLAAGQKDEAFLAYRNAYGRYPTSFAVLMRMGAVNYQTGDYVHARSFYERALNEAPRGSRWRVLNDLGQSYWKLKQPDEAIRLYTEAKAAGMPESELVEWHYRLGWAYFDTGDYPHAIEHYGYVADAGEKYSAASYYNIACAQAQEAKSADPSQRRALQQGAVENLRDAWDATAPAERETLRESLTGSADQRDPDLAPLRNTPEFRAFVKELGPRQ